MSFLSRPKTVQRTSRPNADRKSLFRLAKFLPAVEVLEDRMAPAVLTVNTALDETAADNTLSLREALSVVTAAEAPFVQVPSHINVRDGQISLINNDHTILGLRASAYLMPYLPEKYRLLPLLQSVWYIPAGLDIWNQLLGKYPGRYATMKGITVPPPSYGPVVWNEDQEPIRENGTVEERLHQHMIATVSDRPHQSWDRSPHASALC